MSQQRIYRQFVWVTCKFEGFHRYVNAPDDVAFLREWHRHVFHVRLGVEVSELNREVEFFQLKKKVMEFLGEHYGGKQFESSCEMIANHLRSQFDAVLVEVSEDGENGATVVASGIRFVADDQVQRVISQTLEESRKIGQQIHADAEKINQAVNKMQDNNPKIGGL